MHCHVVSIVVLIYNFAASEPIKKGVATGLEIAENSCDWSQHPECKKSSRFEQRHLVSVILFELHVTTSLFSY
jgi:hypothetical protein